jgi:predicted RNase H-like nuclease
MVRTIVGVDGCRGSWLAVEQRIDAGRLVAAIYASAEALLRAYASAQVICVDVPIGLTDAGPRACDVAARQLLGRPRQSSVFRAPIRPTLAATTREQASALGREADGRGVGCQAWGIYPYVRQWDELLRADPKLQHRVCEVHPEVSFFAMNDNAAMQFSKKRVEGREERRLLLDAVFDHACIDAALETLEGGEFGLDDFYDALAALWTARRVASGNAHRLPAGGPPLDGFGIEMVIRY